MVHFSFLLVLLFLISVTNADIVGPADKAQESFVYRQHIFVIHRLLQKECPDLLRSKRQVADDTAMSLEVTKIVYDNLMETLRKCRLRESQKSAEKKPTTVSSSVPKDCQQLYESGERVSGVYSIDPFPEEMQPFPVWCDFFDGHGWTVFQKRFDGSLDFYRNWAEYQSGFGNAAKEYWLGLDKIYALTKSNQLLNIYVKASNGATRSGTWQTFFIRNETDNYTLTVNDAGYNGTLPSYSFSHHNGMAFSTKDKDNDVYPSNCAVNFHGAWWYSGCYRSNLNGKYGESDKPGIRWYEFSDELTETVMRVTKNADIVGPANQVQELFMYRQQIFAIHRLLQNECPDLARSKREVSDDTGMSLEVMKIVYGSLMETLKKCRLRESENGAEKKPIKVSSSVPKDCQQLYESGKRVSGVYSIDPLPQSMQPFPVWCDFFDGHGWTVFQKRFDGSLDFYCSWADYQSGFGNAAKEYWLGSSMVNEGSYNGMLASSMFSYHNGMPFSTKDKDNDVYGSKCAVYSHGGWWYRSCYRSNLNGKYNAGGDQGIQWVGFSDELTDTVMRVILEQKTSSVIMTTCNKVSWHIIHFYGLAWNKPGCFRYGVKANCMAVKPERLGEK
ncbi:uncharacterized protein [Watersipora subatra]|uniref:uncharacterized protein n=1 Tax=Watersipora subatra TaxID=2589382 RepID=UPI00355B1117